MKCLNLVLALMILSGGCYRATAPTAEQNGAASKFDVPARITNSIGMDLVLIPPGSFMMGSSVSAEQTAQMADGAHAAWFECEHPQHPVRLTRPFYMGVYEVTQAQYLQVIGRNPCRFLNPQNPMENVSWESAQEFCQTLSSLPEEQAAGRVYRLPTEAEWEYACRAGSKSVYSFGDDPKSLADYAWFVENASDETHVVGGKTPNAWGLHDMYGNVAELCSDWWAADYYEHAPGEDPIGPKAGPCRVLRGGCWFNSAVTCRSAFRRRPEPDDRDFDLGFRVVLEVKSPDTADDSP
jgi:formylglycine-generating enzyme required for sulfatase activity